MFTGDRSGDWLYRALHKAGVATQAASVDRGDGLQLRDAVITAVCHCAPPDNKPQTAEIENCRPFLERTLTMARPQVILALGQLAWSAVVKLSRTSPGMFSRPGLASVPVAPQMGQVGAQGTEVPRDRAATQFGHGRVLNLGAVSLVGCYHPSQQNTFTKRLTEAMLDDVIRHVVRLAAADSVADNVERPHR
jgi:uracil-DNA glycosylase